ncbi:MAG: endonuclease V [Elusimicrobiota bacterium]|nr:endonuclease V [Elusimicrobiota bacterium]
MKIKAEGKILCFAKDIKQAREIQLRMKDKIARRNMIDYKSADLIAGCDVAYKGGRAKSAVTVYSKKQKKFVEDVTSDVPCEFPYVPGFLAFREAPALIASLEKLKSDPDIFIFDGQGLSHPFHMGLATHMGIVLDKPSVGCAKSRLYGIAEEPPLIKGSYTFIKEKTGELLGICFRSRKSVKPLWLSIGWGVDIPLVLETVAETMGKYKLPEIMRRADKLSKFEKATPKLKARRGVTADSEVSASSRAMKDK